MKNPCLAVAAMGALLVSGCLLLEERPRTDACVQESVVLGRDADAQGEVIAIPDELAPFSCEDEAGGAADTPGFVIELVSENYGSHRVRATDDQGRLLSVARMSPSCEQRPACSDWSTEGADLPIGSGARSYLVVQPFPTSTTVHLESINIVELCSSTYDGVCDEPNDCPPGTDSYDCDS